MTTDTSRSDSASDGGVHHPTDAGQGDELDWLRAGLACGLVPVGQVQPLLDLARRYGCVAASLTPALRVSETLAGSS